ncbi:MAG: tetratricopeptide repeat protein [Pirellulales bacterium]|nr:tetratricopeptide repeat protein [Pirellulales bacterium]
MNNSPIDSYSKAKLHELAANFYQELRCSATEWKSISDVEPQLRQTRHLIAAGQYDQACAVLNEIDRECLAVWGYQALIIELRSQLVERIDDRKLDALNLGNLGVAYFESNDVQKAIELYEKALVIFRRLGLRAEEGRFLGNRGLARGYNDEGEQDLTQSLAIARDIGDRKHECRWLGNLTDCRLSLDRIDRREAVRNYQTAVEIAREVSDSRFEMIWLRTLGNMFSMEDRWAEAAEALQGSIEAAGRIGARRQQAACLLQLTEIYRRQGDRQGQQACIGRVEQIIGLLDHSTDKIDVLLRLAGLYGDAGDAERQRECCVQALAAARERRDSQAQQYILRLIAGWLQAAERWQECRTVCEQMLALAKESRDPLAEAEAALALAETDFAIGNVEPAARQLENALAIVRDLGNVAGEAMILARLGSMMLNVGNADRAIRYCGDALSVVRRLNDRSSIVVILNRLGMAHYFLKDFTAARDYYRQSLAVSQDIEDREGQSVALFNIGDAYHVEGDAEAAIPYYEEAMEFAQPSTDYKCALGLGIVRLQQGRLQTAQPHFQKCADLCQGEPEKSKALHPRGSALGLALLAMNRPDEALDVYRRGLRLHPSKEDLRYVIFDLELLESTRLSFEGLDEALRLLRSAYGEPYGEQTGATDGER